jgi:hypothetical protein
MNLIYFDALKKTVFCIAKPQTEKVHSIHQVFYFLITILYYTVNIRQTHKLFFNNLQY